MVQNNVILCSSNTEVNDLKVSGWVVVIQIQMLYKAQTCSWYIFFFLPISFISHSLKHMVQTHSLTLAHTRHLVVSVIFAPAMSSHLARLFFVEWGRVGNELFNVGVLFCCEPQPPLTSCLPCHHPWLWHCQCCLMKEKMATYSLHSTGSVFTNLLYFSLCYICLWPSLVYFSFPLYIDFFSNLLWKGMQIIQQ